MRNTATVINISFMIGIILTGNYNFFNLLTIVITLSAVDDNFIVNYTPRFVLRLFNLTGNFVKNEPYKFSEQFSLFFMISGLALILTSLFPHSLILKHKINFNIRDLKEFL